MFEHRANNITPSTCEATVDEKDIEPKINGSAIKVSIPEGTGKLSIRVTAANFWDRTLRLYATSLSASKTNIFFMEKKDAAFTKAYLAEGVRRLNNGEIDAALARFEYAYHGDQNRSDDSELDSYEAILRYNYGRALQQACLRANFDTCDSAAERFNAILDSINLSKETKKMYERNRVNADLVRRALIDLKARDAKILYDRFTIAFVAKDVAKATALLEDVSKSFDQDPKGYEAHGVTRARINADQALLQNNK